MTQGRDQSQRPTPCPHWPAIDPCCWPKCACAPAAKTPPDPAEDFSIWPDGIKKRAREIERFERTGLHVEEADTLAVSSPQSGEGELLREALERVRDQLGDAIHASLRKGTSHVEANVAWNAIRNLPAKEWSNVIQFALDGLGVTAALIPVPRDQATSSASATVCDHLTTEKPEPWRNDLARVYEWMREPDYADELSLEGLTNWVNDRPINEMLRALAANSSASLIANQKNLRGSEPETPPAGDASSRCDTGSKVR